MMEPITDFPPRPLSKSSLTSFICGVLVCIPLLTGFLAVILGIVGMIRTGRRAQRGRWMAVTGLILGVISILAWIGVALMTGGAYAVYKVTAGPRNATHDFIRDISIGDDTTAKDATLGISDDDFSTIAKSIRDEGTFGDTTFPATNITNDSAHVGGFATFTKAGAPHNSHVSCELQNVAGRWKIKAIEVIP